METEFSIEVWTDCAGGRRCLEGREGETRGGRLTCAWARLPKTPSRFRVGEEEEKGCGGMMLLTEKGDEDGWRGKRSVTTEIQTSFNQRS